MPCQVHYKESKFGKVFAKLFNADYFGMGSHLEAMNYGTVNIIFSAYSSSDCCCL